MIIRINHNNEEYEIDTSHVVDLSIPYNFNGKQPNFYDVKKGQLGKVSALTIFLKDWIMLLDSQSLKSTESGNSVHDSILKILRVAENPSQNRSNATCRISFACIGANICKFSTLFSLIKSGASSVAGTNDKCRSG